MDELSEALAALREDGPQDDVDGIADAIHKAGKDSDPTPVSERLKAAEERSKAARRAEREHIVSLLAEQDEK